MGSSGRSQKLCWSRYDKEFGRVGILVKEVIFENVVEVRRKCDRVIAIVQTLGREVIRMICAYKPYERYGS